MPSTSNQKHIHKHKNRVFFTNYFDLETAHIGQSHKNGETLEFERPVSRGGKRYACFSGDRRGQAEKVHQPLSKNGIFLILPKIFV